MTSAEKILGPSVLVLTSIVVGSSLAGIFTNCTGTADQRAAKFAKGAADLCSLRAAAAGVEEAFPDTKPAPGSLRDKLEAEEDKFCALELEHADAAPNP